MRGLVADLLARGFDASWLEPATPGSPASAQVRCSQCEALVICGVPCHEQGCPNRNWPCCECDEGRARRQGGVCEGCQEALSNEEGEEAYRAPFLSIAECDHEGPDPCSHCCPCEDCGYLRAREEVEGEEV